MSTSPATLSQIVADRTSLFAAANNAGDGFSPTITERWTLHYASQSTDDVDVYTDESGRVVLVGDAHGEWAVRPA